jgi:hypothetical protein
MTLKEKLQVEIMHLTNMYEVVDAVGINLENVADGFAIGFAEWMRGFRYDNAELYFRSSAKELLEIYKKEKGL